jgi:hypothetical protein
MIKKQIAIFGLLFLLAATILPLPIRPCLAADNTPTFPKFEKIEAAVLRYFQSQPDFQPSMLITREQVEPLVGVLELMGFKLPNPKTILDKLPANNEFLVVELYSQQGRKFMEQIADYPNAYDRLDRLSRLPYGKQTIHDLIVGPDGHKMIQYLTTASGGKEMGKQLANAPQGENFNKPTGRIYTVSMLIKNLQSQYREAEKIQQPVPNKKK